MYLHNNDFHTENFILCTSFVCDVGKLVDLWWIHLLKTVKPNVILEKQTKRLKHSAVHAKYELIGSFSTFANV